jgi:F0F1-type ATP synthase membrane subunit a
MKGVPGGAQNLLEWLVESLYSFLEDIIGPHLVKRTFWHEMGPLE